MSKINYYSKQSTYCALFFVLCFCFTAKSQKKIEYVLPTALFNKEEAYKMLEEGNNSIQGTISFKKRGYVNYPGYMAKVLLYPVTPHLAEYIELKKKYNSRKKQAAMTKEAAMARIETKTIDNKGNFEFINVKPGKYYIVSLVVWEKVRGNQVQTGPAVVNRNVYGIQMGGGSVPTETRYDSQAYEEEIGDYIEIPGNNKVTVINIAQ